MCLVLFRACTRVKQAVVVQFGSAEVPKCIAGARSAVRCPDRPFLHLGGAGAAKSRRAQPHFFRAPVSVVPCVRAMLHFFHSARKFSKIRPL